MFNHAQIDKQNTSVKRKKRWIGSTGKILTGNECFFLWKYVPLNQSIDNMIDWLNEQRLI